MPTVELRDILLFGTPLVTSALSLGLMHWLPWNGGAKELERPTAYALGTIVTVGVPAMTMLVAHALGMARTELFWASLLIINALVSGATVNIAYWVDSGRAITLDEVQGNAAR